MMKKLMMSVVIIIVGAMLVGMGTFALFTSESSNMGSTFTVGKVEIKDVTKGTAVSSSKYYNNLTPGDHETYSLTIENQGTLDAWINIDEIKSKNSEVGAIFEGKTPLKINYKLNDDILVPAGKTATLQIEYELPIKADNFYQGVEGKSDIFVKAVQARNNANSTESGPISWN